MKFAVLLFVFMGSTKYCSKIDMYLVHLNGLNNEHPPIIHKMESVLADQLNSDDSATKEWARGFWNNFESEFNSYTPDEKAMRKLFQLNKNGLEIKVIGGDWCSDTRREVPRLCKVLHLAGFDPDKFSYFRVDKAKKAILNDFATEYKVTVVPTVVVYKNGIETGKVLETPGTTWEKDLVQITTVLSGK